MMEKNSEVEAQTKEQENGDSYLACDHCDCTAIKKRSLQRNVLPQSMLQIGPTTTVDRESASKSTNELLELNTIKLDWLVLPITLVLTHFV